MSDIGECVEHTGYRNRCGYGWVSYKGKQMHAHRRAWMQANGQLRSDQHVLHRCDNRACIRLSHLFIGSHAENMKDASEKGRMRGWMSFGEKHYRASISEIEALKVIELGRQGLLHREISAALNVSKYVVKQILAGTRWKHLNGAVRRHHSAK